VKPASVLPRHSGRRGAISEKDWAQTVVEYAELMGWLVYRTWNSLHSPAGYPDLTLVRERVVWAELKSGDGIVTTAQWDWHYALKQAGQEAYIWRPADWEYGVQRVLGR